MFRICTSLALMRQMSFRASSRWKCDVDTKGTPTFLPTRSLGFSMPEPLRAISASDLPILSRIQKSCMSTPRVTAAVIPVDPNTPTGTSREANALEMSPAELNWRQSTSYPASCSALSKLPSAMALTKGPTIC